MLILGGGIVGQGALSILYALGANCTVMDINVGVLKMLGIDENNYFRETTPAFTATVSPFVSQLQHFADCCNGKTQCLCPAHQGTQIIRIMNAIYQSAETGEEIVFG